MKPWKRRMSGVAHSPDPSLQWGHGDEAVEEGGASARTQIPCRFNGATAMKPWKSRSIDFIYKRRPRLQWGHGDEAVEELSDMEDGHRWYVLQWGHGDEAVEERDLAPTAKPR